jgi:5,10-methylenetetrahydrofolate reductase
VELSPPKGTDTAALLRHARSLAPLVTAFNLTDNQSAVMHLSSLAASKLILDTGSDVIFQITGRDRNRIALQSDLLAASVFGIGNVLALTGDHVSCGDHPGAKAVFDLDSVHILQVVEGLNAGHDLAGRPLAGSTRLFPGAAVAPEYEPFDLQWLKCEKKAAMGARFFQTQAVFNPKALERLMKRASSLPVPVLAGVLLLKSPSMADFINRKVPGLHVPSSLVRRLESAADPQREGVAIALEQIRTFRGLCQGIHLMTAGREDVAAEILGRL